MNVMQPSLKKFLDQLCGEFSNLEQALDNPPFFAHIFIRYRPIEHLQTGSILIDQSYAIDPKNPYRLRVIKAEKCDSGTIKLWNHKFREPQHFASATFDQTRRQEISDRDLICLDQCHYQVTERDGGYHGELEEGCRCIVHRDGRDTVLVSSFHLQGEALSTLDRGYDPETGERRWGAIAGEYRFKKSASWKADWN